MLALIVTWTHGKRKQRNKRVHRKKKFLWIMNYNQLDAVPIYLLIIIRYCLFVVFLEVHFPLYVVVFKKVQGKNLLPKLLIQKSYPHEVWRKKIWRIKNSNKIQLHRSSKTWTRSSNLSTIKTSEYRYKQSVIWKYFLI